MENARNISPMIDRIMIRTGTGTWFGVQFPSHAKKKTICPGLSPLRVWGERRFTELVSSD